MKMVYILRGIPGAGKSTYGKTLVDRAIAAGDKAVQYEADMFFTDKAGNYNWNPKLIGVAHKWCQDKVRNALGNYDVVVVANTNLTKKDVDVYTKIATDGGYDFEVIRLDGGFQNVHAVPEETLENMRKKMEDYPGELKV